MKLSLPSSSNTIRSVLIGYGIVAGSLMAYNLRWRYFGEYLSSILFGRQAKVLPMTIVNGDNDKTSTNNNNNNKVIVVLLHGMWHDASWYSELQLLLQQHGYTSYAIDLLPGERFFPGFSQSEIVADLEETLLVHPRQGQKNTTKTDDGDGSQQQQQQIQYILVGHSQGGLVVQSCLQNSSELAAHTKACVLLGTYPLGLPPPMEKLLRQQPRNMYNHWGYLGICLTGKLVSLKYLQHIFLLPTTDPATRKEYTDKILQAPSDGFITMSHFLVPSSTKNGNTNTSIISTKPTLVLGAAQDIIYPPHFLQEDFDIRFPNATHKIIPNQAHCFMDPIMTSNANKKDNNDDNDADMKQVLVHWLDKITA